MEEPSMSCFGRILPFYEIRRLKNSLSLKKIEQTHAYDTVRVIGNSIREFGNDDFWNESPMRLKEAFSCST